MGIEVLGFSRAMMIPEIFPKFVNDVIETWYCPLCFIYLNFLAASYLHLARLFCLRHVTAPGPVVLGLLSPAEEMSARASATSSRITFFSGIKPSGSVNLKSSPWPSWLLSPKLHKEHTFPGLWNISMFSSNISLPIYIMEGKRRRIRFKKGYARVQNW